MLLETVQEKFTFFFFLPLFQEGFHHQEMLLYWNLISTPVVGGRLQLFLIQNP